MNTFKLVISTPDGKLFSDEVYKISLRGAEGDLAIMANHIPFATSVKPCVCRIETKDEKNLSLEVERGLLSVSSNCTTLMSGSAKWLNK